MTKKGAVAARTAAVKRRTFTREFKLKVIREVEAGKSQAQVARGYQITENRISKWRRQHWQYQDRALLDVVTPTLTKHACTNSSAWWAGSPWRMTF
jgi:transposase-like protein